MSPSRNHSTLRTRELGIELHRLRDAAHLSGQYVADTLGMSQAWLSKLETGARQTSILELGTLLGFYKAPPEARKRVARLLAEGDSGSVVRLHDGSPDSLAVATSNVELTAAIKSYDPLIVPWPLQTEAYARAVTGDQAATQARMERQATLFRRFDSPPKVTVYVPEAAVLRPGAPGAVMHEQLQYLASLQEWYRVDVHVVPERPVFNPALRHAVTLLELKEPQSPVVYEETETALVLHDAGTAVVAAMSKFRRLARVATPAEQSRLLFAQWSARFGANSS